MSNSPLTDIVRLSPNHSGPRLHKIDRITPHCVVGQATAERIGEIFENKSRKASCNYGIGRDGRIVLVVPENCRSWCSSSKTNDDRAVTIECASSSIDPYEMTGEVWESLRKLCVDICRRNDKTRLIWEPDKEKALSRKLEPGDMLLTVHRWFANKACPGNWLFDRLGILASIVTARLQEKSWTVRIVQQGDTLWSLAREHLGKGSRWTEIAELNGLTSTCLTVGQPIKIPKEG